MEILEIPQKQVNSMAQLKICSPLKTVLLGDDLVCIVSVKNFAKFHRNVEIL